MKSHTTVLLLTLLALLQGGCYQSNSIKQEAINLDTTVQNFKSQRQQQIQALNQTFQDTYEKLMDQLTALCDAQMDLSRDLDAQNVADQAMTDPNAVLMPSAMHDHTLGFITDQWSKIHVVDQELTDAQTSYANSSKTLSVSLNQLDNIDSALKKLINESNSPDAQTILQYLESGYNGVKSGISTAKTDIAKSSNSAPPVAPAIPAR